MKLPEAAAFCRGFFFLQKLRIRTKFFLSPGRVWPMVLIPPAKNHSLSLAPCGLSPGLHGRAIFFKINPPISWDFGGPEKSQLQGMRKNRKESP
jgi:hypothetical protein